VEEIMPRSAATQEFAYNKSMATFYLDVEGLKSTDNSFNMNRITELLDLKPMEIGSIFGISRQNAHKILPLKSYHPRNAEVFEKLSQIVKCIVLLILILKIPENTRDQAELESKMAQWFKVPNPSYDMKSPSEMISQGRGEEVVRSLQSIFDSSFA